MEKIYEEVAFIAYYFNWDRDRIMNMEHNERQKWCNKISSINKKMNSSTDEISITELI